MLHLGLQLAHFVFEAISLSLLKVKRGLQLGDRLSHFVVFDAERSILFIGIQEIVWSVVHGSQGVLLVSCFPLQIFVGLTELFKSFLFLFLSSAILGAFHDSLVEGAILTKSVKCLFDDSPLLALLDLEQSFVQGDDLVFELREGGLLGGDDFLVLFHLLLLFLDLFEGYGVICACQRFFEGLLPPCISFLPLLLLGNSRLQRNAGFGGREVGVHELAQLGGHRVRRRVGWV